MTTDYFLRLDFHCVIIVRGFQRVTMERKTNNRIDLHIHRFHRTLQRPKSLTLQHNLSCIPHIIRGI